jgi:hypothetical protein
MTMVVRLLRFLVIMLIGLTVGMAVFHLMAMPTRLEWSEAQWLAETVRSGLYHPFGALGAGIAFASVIGLAVLAVIVRRHRRWVARLSTLAATMFVLALLVWWAMVFPVNVEIADWTAGAVPPDWSRTRLRWEIGHAIAAALEFTGFCALVWSVLLASDDGPAQ